MTKTKTGKKTETSNKIHMNDKTKKESEQKQEQKQKQQDEQDELIDQLCIPFKKRNQFSNEDMYIDQNKQLFWGSKRKLLSHLTDITVSNQRHSVHLSDSGFQKLLDSVIKMCNEELFTSYENYDIEKYCWKLVYVDNLMGIISNLLIGSGHRFTKVLVTSGSNLLPICLQHIGNLNLKMKFSRLVYQPIFLIHCTITPYLLDESCKVDKIITTTNIVSYRKRIEYCMLILILLLNHFLEACSNNPSRIDKVWYQSCGNGLFSCSLTMNKLLHAGHIIFGSKMFHSLQDSFHCCSKLLYLYGDPDRNVFSNYATPPLIAGIIDFSRQILKMKWLKATKKESDQWIVDILSNEIIDNHTFLDIVSLYQNKTRILHCKKVNDNFNDDFDYMINELVRSVKMVFAEMLEQLMFDARSEVRRLNTEYLKKVKYCLSYFVDDNVEVKDLSDDIHKIKYSKKRCGYYPDCFTDEKPIHTCSACKTINYCSRTCASADWKDHKKYCIKKGK